MAKATKTAAPQAEAMTFEEAALRAELAAVKAAAAATHGACVAAHHTLDAVEWCLEHPKTTLVGVAAGVGLAVYLAN